MIREDPSERTERDGRAALLAPLNDRQRDAVTHVGGPLIVLAGAGSGKTRVITHRIAHLILDVGVPAWRIVAVTFTNKAAAEMRGRVEGLLGRSDSGAWVGTFHGLCLRVLRRDGARVGLAPGFVIYDSDDQLAVVKRILKSEGAGDDPAATPRSLLSRISRAKNALESVADVEHRAFNPERRLLARVYAQYEAELRKANAVDFDDLLLRTLDLLGSDESVAARYADACEHLLVDEYQDTNRPQYLLVRALSARHGNVCVVGDEDQCIYRFRGAELRNILEFERDHPGARAIHLEQNYRSTSTILGAAGSIIARNVQRKGKRLWTENAVGEKLELCRAADDRSEAQWVATRARALEAISAFDSMAVLYRTNAQSRQLEEAFRRERIPFQVVGALQFYERREIKDLLAYLKLIANPADDVAFRRIVNTPTRGVGDTTLRSIEGIAASTGLPLYEAAAQALEQTALGGRAAKPLRSFVDFVADCRRFAEEHSVGELLEQVVRGVEYEAWLERLHGPLATERMENVRALVSAAAEHAEDDDGSGLASFLDHAALVADADEVGQRPGVTLTTVHCAKGLEFAVVFLVGLEENLFPHALALRSADDIEEERRLCYVALTRARLRLLLAHAHVRRFQGAFLPSRPSRFLDEIPEELVREVVPPDPPWLGRSSGVAERAAVGSSAALAAARARPASPAPALVLGPRPAAVAAADGYGVGAFVEHPKFGGGRILEREGEGQHLKLTIHFSDWGPKKILPAYTTLRLHAG